MYDERVSGSRLTQNRAHALQVGPRIRHLYKVAFAFCPTNSHARFGCSSVSTDQEISKYRENLHCVQDR